MADDSPENRRAVFDSNLKHLIEEVTGVPETKDYSEERAEAWRAADSRWATMRKGPPQLGEWRLLNQSYTPRRRAP